MSKPTKKEAALLQAVTRTLDYDPGRTGLDGRLSFLIGYLERDHPHLSEAIRILRDGKEAA